MPSLDKRREQLQQRQQFLLKRMSRIDAELDAHEAKDFEEMATEREGDEVLEDLGHSARHELRMIEAALHRIEAGEYGECVSCGAEIDPERLDLVPATPFCASCAAKR